MKTKEELNAIKEEVETLNKKLSALNEAELAQVVGGIGGSATLDVAREIAQSIFGGTPEIDCEDQLAQGPGSYGMTDT